MTERNSVLSHNRRFLSPPANLQSEHYSDDDEPSRSVSPSPYFSRKKSWLELNENPELLGAPLQPWELMRNSFRSLRGRSFTSLFSRKSSHGKNSFLGAPGSIISSLSAPNFGQELSFLAASFYSSSKRKRLEQSEFLSSFLCLVEREIR